MTETEKIRRFIYKLLALNARLNVIESELISLLAEKPSSPEATELANETISKIAADKNRVFEQYKEANNTLG